MVEVILRIQIHKQEILGSGDTDKQGYMLLFFDTIGSHFLVNKNQIMRDIILIDKTKF